MTNESLLTYIDKYLSVSLSPNKDKFQHRKAPRQQVMARKKPTESLKDWETSFYTNATVYERETGERYFPDPTAEELRLAQEQNPLVEDVVHGSGRVEYHVGAPASAALVPGGTAFCLPQLGSRPAHLF